MNETTDLKLMDSDMSAKLMMKQLSTNDTDIQLDMNSDMLLDRTKLFLIAQARNSLNRIIKLTNFLEKLEDKFIAAVSTRLENDADNITVIAMSMETVSKLLQDANNTVTQIIKDEKLQQVIINTTNIITPDGNSATVIDANSRDEVRNLAASLLAQLSKVSESIETEAEGDDINV